MPLLKYGTSEMEYTLEDQEEADIIIKIDWINGLKVKVPYNTGQKEINKVIKKKANLISFSLSKG